MDTLIIENYKPFSEIFDIIEPSIPTSFQYRFLSSSDLMYLVQFAKTQFYQNVIVNFTIDDDDSYDNDYPVTNKGELYKIIATVIEVIRRFQFQHPIIRSYEFCGEFKDSGEHHHSSSIRTRLYYRFAQRYLNKNWTVTMCDNKVIISKK